MRAFAVRDIIGPLYCLSELVRLKIGLWMMRAHYVLCAACICRPSGLR